LGKHRRKYTKRLIQLLTKTKNEEIDRTTDRYLLGKPKIQNTKINYKSFLGKHRRKSE
jgi:hypothetical protein